MLGIDCEKFWSPVFDNMKEVVFIIDADLKLLRVNKTFLAFVGKEEKDVLGRDVCEVLHGGHNLSPDSPCREIFGSRSALQKEFFDYYLKKWLDVHLTPLYSGNEFNANIVLLSDITKRRQKEAEIEREYEMQRVINSILYLSLEEIGLDEFLRIAFDLIFLTPWLTETRQCAGALFLVEDKPDALVLKAQEGFSLEAQKNCKEVPFGKHICGEVALRKKLRFIDAFSEGCVISSEECPSHAHYCVPIVSLDKTLGVIYLCLKKDYQWNEKDEDFLIAIANSIAGVIERRLAEKELEKINELNQRLLNTIPFGIDIVDESGSIMFLNHVFEAIVGKEAFGKKCWQLYREDKVIPPSCPLIEGIDAGETRSIEVDGVFGEKTYQIFHRRKAPACHAG